jgi:hypothetical protein
VPEYSFLPVTLTNNEVHLECLQRSAVVADWPAYTNIIVSREDMLNAMDETRARGEKAKYAGVEYLIER